MRALLPLLALTAIACQRAPVVDGVGDHLRSFIVSTSSVTKPTCYVCEYGGKPVVVAIGDPDDPAFQGELTALQALANRHKDKELRVFAVASKRSDGKHTPFPDEAAALTKLAELRRALGIEYPLALVPKDSEQYYKQGFHRFDTTYLLPGTRTLLFAGRDGKVQWMGDKTDDAMTKLVEAAL